MTPNEHLRKMKAIEKANKKMLEKLAAIAKKYTTIQLEKKRAKMKISDLHRSIAPQLVKLEVKFDALDLQEKELLKESSNLLEEVAKKLFGLL